MPEKVYEENFFFSLISKNLNWDILTTNLTTFKRSDGVNLNIIGVHLKNPIFKGVLTKSHYI